MTYNSGTSSIIVTAVLCIIVISIISACTCQLPNGYHTEIVNAIKRSYPCSNTAGWKPFYASHVLVQSTDGTSTAKVKFLNSDPVGEFEIGIFIPIGGSNQYINSIKQIKGFCTDCAIISSASMAVNAANWARSKIGASYSSTFVHDAYRLVGVLNLPTSAKGYPDSTSTIRISINEPLQIGDILVKQPEYNNDGMLVGGHTGIYVGKQEAISSENPSVGIVRRSIIMYQLFIGYTAVYRVVQKNY